MSTRWRKAKKAPPYSFVLARGDEADGEISINRWLADALDAKAGNTVEMRYFELLPDNQFAERSRFFVVSKIIPMADLERERKLVPQFPGLSDVDRCADWDAGIPMEEEALDDAANEEYWNQFKQTPKAIISLNVGQQMWANRFGNLTSVRWDRPPQNIEQAFRAAFNPSAAGFVFQPVRDQALAAVNQAMDFGELFVGMSFFLIVAALMLTGLLFVFGVQRRSEEMGILLATGWSPRAVRKLFLIEGSAIALVGSVLGAVLGTGYTRALIFGLAHYWNGAVANSAIEYFAQPKTVIVGGVSSWICAMLAMGIAVWRQARHPARELLMADFSQPASSGKQTQTKLGGMAALLCGLGAIGTILYALVGNAPSVTMLFFSAGALLLVAGVLLFNGLLRRLDRLESLPHILGMALRNVARRRGRSLTVIGLLACGTFLVFAVSSMKEDVTAHAAEPNSGTGGFAWFGESTVPISDDLGGVRLRVRDGDDASCLNLNRAQSPRLLGVNPATLSKRKAFLVNEDLWSLLNTNLPDGAVPGLAGDSDTALWGLEAKVGDQFDYYDEAGRPFKVQLVGMLSMRLSVFQGNLLIAEKSFVQKFPSESGYRMFLLDTPPTARKYARAGLDVVRSTERLMEFYAVESTYLAMFLVLGALGLVVGSMGMGVVVLRNVQDRRIEFAVLQALGYRTAVLRKLLLIEHGFLLFAGLGIGIIASAVAMVPAVILSHSEASPAFLIGLLATVLTCGIVCIGVAIKLALWGISAQGLRDE